MRINDAIRIAVNCAEKYENELRKLYLPVQLNSEAPLKNLNFLFALTQVYTIWIPGDYYLKIAVLLVIINLTSIL